ncbi:MAG: hypothetical protein ABF904_15100, partial [Ethanoligenens sp.]
DFSRLHYFFASEISGMAQFFTHPSFQLGVLSCLFCDNKIGASAIADAPCDTAKTVWWREMDSDHRSN